MKLRWRLLLPVVGLLLFSFGSYESFAHRVFPHSRYFWWSSIRLDSDPLNKRFPAERPLCRNNADDSVDCALVDPLGVYVNPGWLARFLFLTALPAFLLGAGVVGGLGRLGVSQLLSFMISMPLLICAWFYFVGWVVDRWLTRRRIKSA